MAENEIQALILSELQSLRGEFNSHSRETGERLASLEQGMKTAIVGNGSKSRLTIVEEHIDSLRQWKWRVTGISVGVAGVASFLFHLAEVGK